MENSWIMKLFYVEGWVILGAFLIDWIFGDPKKYHPISAIGKMIERIEFFLRKLGLNGKFGGFLLFFTTVLIVFLFSIIFIWLLEKLAKLSWIANFFSNLVLVTISSLFIALRGLVDMAKKVEKLLEEGNLLQARILLKALVGRNTENLAPEKIRIAIVESLSENLSDGVIASLFYFILGGFPFLVLYKTVNTLDSMVGYKNEKYINFGWFSAKMDDLFNYIPARISGLMIVVSSLILLGIGSAKNSLRIMLRDGRKHLSPNSGIPEAAMAGALGIRLGGPNYYGGVLVNKPYIGEVLAYKENFVELAQKIVILSSFFFVFIALILRSVFIRSLS
jgi:adenosylcobinamide-phosphate synthase